MKSDEATKNRNREGRPQLPYSILDDRHSTFDGLRFLTVAALIVALSAPATLASVPLSSVDSEGVPSAVQGGAMEALLFYLVAGGVALSVLGICMSRNIVRMAVWLFVALGSVAMLYFMLAATFLGAIQLIVYAGGTLVLLVFGVMLTSRSPWVKFECSRLELAAATIVCVSLAVSLGLVVSRAAWSTTPALVPGPAIVTIGTQLLTKYLVPFEVAGVLLMIVMVGAAYLARQEE